MVYEENIEKLKKSMKINTTKKTGKHIINKSAPILPFPTRNPERAKFARKMFGVVGELARIINGKKLLDNFNIDTYIEKIVDVVNCKKEDRIYLKKLIKEYLIDNDGNIKIFHINLFNYIELTPGNESVGEKNIAQFLYDLFFKDITEVKRLFENKDSKNIIAKLILLKLNGLEDTEVKSVYIDKLNYITSVAKEDIEFLCKHEEFFIKNFDKLIAYYYFYYITQLSIKLDKKKNADFNKIEEIYYLLDWERAGKNRQSTTKGYSYIKSSSKQLLVNINVLEHLNFLFGTKGYDLPEIYKLYNNLDEYEKFNYLSTIASWISFYRKLFDQEDSELEMDLDKLINELEKSLLRKIDKATMSRYALSIEEIGKKYLLKYRGVYKYMLNLNQEMILLLTAVSIKKDKISLKALFKEYERRGVFLDKYSKGEIIELLSKLNLIDKKSDSGDAQYVKSIL